MSLEALFCDADDFCQTYLPAWQHQLLSDGQLKHTRQGQLSVSELMTIIIHFHQSRYRDFKTYYLWHVHCYLKSTFPKLISYSRFVA